MKVDKITRKKNSRGRHGWTKKERTTPNAKSSMLSYSKRKKRKREREAISIQIDLANGYMLNCIHFVCAAKLISNDKNVRCRKRRFVYSTISFGQILLLCVSAVRCCCCCCSRCVCKREKKCRFNGALFGVFDMRGTEQTITFGTTVDETVWNRILEHHNMTEEQKNTATEKIKTKQQKKSSTQCHSNRFVVLCCARALHEF